MVDLIEELLQVDIHDIAVAVGNVGLGFMQRIVLAPSRSEAEACLREVRLPDGLQALGNGVLNQPIQHGWDAQKAFAAVGFRDFHPPYRQRPVGALQ